jgi:Ser/Thr protein kinase RdoA (MazF antagonist)
MEQVGKKDKLKKEEILVAAEFFGLGKISSYSLIKAGNINSNYILKAAGGRYILRAYKFKKEEEILCELELLNFLSQKNFPCPSPIGPIFKTANKFICCFKFIEGKAPGKITNKMLENIAELMAEFHKLSANFHTKNYREGEGIGVIKKYLKNKKRFILKSRFKDSKNFIEFLEVELDKLRLDKDLPRGAIHVDIKAENIIIGKDGRMYFIDFDNFYLDAYIMDVVSSILWLCEEKDKLNLKKAEIFLFAYNKQRKITAKELAGFKDYVKFHCLKGVFKYAYICLPRLKFAERWAYHFIDVYRNISKQKINFEVI